MNNGPLNQILGSSINLNYLKLFQLQKLIPLNSRLLQPKTDKKAPQKGLGLRREVQRTAPKETFN